MTENQAPSAERFEVYSHERHMAPDDWYVWDRGTQKTVYGPVPKEQAETYSFARNSRARPGKWYPRGS